jgi:hypothetical protein
MDKVQKTAFTDYNAPSSEPFRLHFEKQLNNSSLVLQSSHEQIFNNLSLYLQ